MESRVLRCILLASVLAGAAALAPAGASAQPGCLECEGGGGPGDPDPAQPQAFIEPAQSNHAGLVAGMPLPLRVTWCTERGEHDPATALVLVNGDTVSLSPDPDWSACPVGTTGFSSHL